MPIRAKNHRREVVSGLFKKAAIAGVAVAGIYGVSVAYYNSGSPAGGDNTDTINSILSRSKYEYIAQASRAQKPPRLSISVSDVYQVEDSDTIDLYADVGNDFITAYSAVDTAAKSWNETTGKMLQKIATPEDTGFTFTFQKESGDSTLLKIAKQYQIGIVPGESAIAWPKMDLRLGQNGYYGTISLSKGWDEKENTEALRAFLQALKADTEASKTARREADENLSGAYSLERNNFEGGFIVRVNRTPAAEPANTNIVETSTQAKPLRTAVTQYEAGPRDPQETVLIWSRLDYMEQLLDTKSVTLSLSLTDVYEAANGNDANIISFYKGTAADDFVAAYNKARAVSDKWNNVVARIATDVGNDQKGLITAGSFYRLGIIPAAPGASESEMTLTANANGVYYATMTLPVNWDDKVGAGALRAFMTKLKEDKEAGKVTASVYKLKGDAADKFSAYKVEQKQAVVPAAPKF